MKKKIALVITIAVCIVSVLSLIHIYEEEKKIFVAEDMYQLGSQRSAIRELFEYGKQRAVRCRYGRVSKGKIIDIFRSHNCCALLSILK